jgi:outer membrane protein OmpA-like peptidoglycan-associated protein
MKRWLVMFGFFPGAVYGQESTELDAEFFKPAPGNSVFGVKEATLVPHMKLSFEALFHLAQNPLVATSGLQRNSQSTNIIATQMVTDIMASVGVRGFAEFGVALPFALAQSGEEQSFLTNSAVISGSSLGDFRLSAKLRLNRRDQDKFTMVFAPEVSLPTGDGSQFFGSKSTSALLSFAASVKFPKFTLSANAGSRIKESVEVLNQSVGSSVEAGLGASYRASDRVVLLSEMNGAVSLNGPGSGQSPAEARVGARFKIGKSLWLPIGAGVGVTDGIGSPDFRVITGLSILPEADFDQDGFVGNDDQCPEQAEDKDQFQDQDGCPDLDNDRDGVLDVSDDCLNEPGDLSAFGCPDADQDSVADQQDMCPSVAGSATLAGCSDSDGDLIVDEQDSCPQEKGSAAFSGCADLDGDLIADVQDACPSKAGPRTQDGCPDSDGDTIADQWDACPTEAEDPDGFEEQDGCPEPDNDMDAVLDASDQCPSQIEDGLGSAPQDGCPNTKQVTLSGDSIFVMGTIYFDTNKASLQKRSHALLDEVAAVLLSHPELTQIEIQGHTDDQGDDKFNARLSSRRAKEVQEYLIKKGVDPSRLSSTGYGEASPLIAVAGLNKQELRDAREKNRRVEFKIVK